MKRRTTILEGLNDHYGRLIEKAKISEAYATIVSNKPFKILSSFGYEWSFPPLKRGQLEEVMKEPLSPKPGKIIRNKAAQKCFGKTVQSTPCSKEKKTCREDDLEFTHPSHR